MRIINGNKYLIAGVVLIVTLFFLALTPAQITHGGNPIPPVTVTLLENSADHLIINYALHDFTLTPLSINNDTYYFLHLGDESNSEQAGAPNLPTICRSIIIPNQALMTGTVISSSYQDHENMLIAPARGDFTHNSNPGDIPYVFGPIYEIDDWYPGSLVELHNPYILRDFRGQVIQVNPFQYNPVTHTLREYTSLTLEITSQGTGGENTIEQEELGPISTDFHMIYERHFLNYGEQEPPLEGDPLYTPVGEIGNMLIITYDNFYAAMQPFVTWKNMKGIPTEIINRTSIGGGTATDIDTYIENYYTTNGLTFVLLVGDIDEIPTLYSYGSASDPSYSYIVGNDHYPDLFMGRFSAETVAQVETQVERSIEYERYPLDGGTWYHNGTGIASSQGPGDDGEYDYEHMRNIRTDLLGYTYTLINEFYDGSQGGDDAPGNPSESMVSAALNDGRSIVNYCGHGSDTGWSTSGFSNADINGLVNDNMLPYVVCVACNNGEFDSSVTCFAETWMRATHTGESTGGIGVYASSQSQSWSPPMDAQDEIMDILVETYPGNIKHSLGGLSYNGAMHMADEYPGDLDEIDTWTLFGDPSLQIRTDTPASLTVSHDLLINNGATTFNVTVAGVEGALCALSQNGVLLGANYTDNAGSALISTDPITNPLPVDLVVTAFNKIPYNATIPVGDNNPPLITDIAHLPLAPVMGDMVNITCTVTDDGGVDTVLISILDPMDILLEASMVHYPGTNTYYYNTTCQLPGDYHITIWANDSTGNAIAAPVYILPVQLIHSYTLYEGWNVITIPVEGDYTAESLGENISGCSVVIMFDGSNQSFATHVVGTPHDNFPIEAGRGYFVYLSKNTTASVTGFLLDTLALPIYTGWNLIGWFQGTTTDANTIGQTIPGTTVVTMFNAQNQIFISHVVTSKGVPWDNFVITRGMGLFIYTNENSTWNGYV